MKVRGYRVELGEIEARLREHAGVGEAVVLAREDTIGDQRLVAYYTRAEENGGGGGIGAEELRQHLSAKLPEYMAPSGICVFGEAAVDAEREVGPEGAAGAGDRGIWSAQITKSQSGRSRGRWRRSGPRC